MPRNTTGGTGHKARARRATQEKRQGVTLNVEEGEGFYGEVVRTLGDSTFEVKLQDQTNTQCNIPGRMRKKQWVRVGDKVLVSADKTEIVKIIRETDKDAQEAKHALRKANGHSVVFGDVTGLESDNDDDDIDDAIGNLNAHASIASKEEKMEQVARWKRADKERGQARRQDREEQKYSEECSNINVILEDL